VDVGGDEPQRVPDVQPRPRRVREHVHDEEVALAVHQARVVRLGPGAGRVGRVEDVVALPALLPGPLDLVGQLRRVAVLRDLVVHRLFVLTSLRGAYTKKPLSQEGSAAPAPGWRSARLAEKQVVPHVSNPSAEQATDAARPRRSRRAAGSGNPGADVADPPGHAARRPPDRWAPRVLGARACVRAGRTAEPAPTSCWRPGSCG